MTIWRIHAHVIYPKGDPRQRPHGFDFAELVAAETAEQAIDLFKHHHENAAACTISSVTKAGQMVAWPELMGGRP